MWPSVRTKNVYEAIMLKKRAAEENRQAQEKATEKFFKAAELRANKEKFWTSDTSFKHSILAYLQPKKEDILERLESRRNKLRALLRDENNAFNRILNGCLEESNGTVEKMKQEYYRLAAEHVEERSERATRLIHQQFVKNDPQLRGTISNSGDEQLIDSWEKEVNANNEARAQDALENMAFEAGCTETRMQEDATERHERQQKNEQDKRHVEFLQQQIEELKQREQEVNELNSEREHLLAEKVRISELEEERQAIDEERRRQSYGKAILRQHAAALRRRSRQVQKEIETDIQWLSRVIQQQSLNHAHAQDAADRLRSEGTAMLSMLEDDLRRERTRDAQMEDLYSQEAAEVWKKQNQRWMHEQDARTRLLNEILAARREQVNARLGEVRQLQAQKLAESECMQKLVKEARLSDEAHQEKTRERQQEQAEELENQRPERQQNNKATGRDVLSNGELERKVEEAYAEALRAEAERLQVTDSYTPSKGRGQSFYDHRRKTYLW